MARTSIILRGMCSIAVAAAFALPAQAQDLTFGYPGTPAGAFAIVTTKLDAFNKHGVAVSTVEQAAAINVRDALVSGSLDIGFPGLSNFIVAVASGAPLVTIGVAVDQCAGTAVVVRKESAYQVLADLKGKKIGSEIATVTHGSFVNGVLPKNQLSAKDVQITNVRFRDMVSALLSDSVEAITAVEPFLSQGEAAGTLRILTDFCPYAPVPVLIATAAPTIAKKTPAIKSFMAALMETAQLFASDPERAAQIYGDTLRTKGFDIAPATVLQIIKRLNITPDRVRLSPAMIEYAEQEAQRMKDNGQIDTVPDMKQAFDRSFSGG